MPLAVIEADWPAALVAVALIALVAVVSIQAIRKYSADQALKMMGAMSGITGVIIGIMSTYFFGVRPAQIDANDAQIDANKREIGVIRQLGRFLPPEQYSDLFGDCRAELLTWLTGVEDDSREAALQEWMENEQGIQGMTGIFWVLRSETSEDDLCAARDSVLSAPTSEP